MILMYKYLCYNNVNSVILTQFSCDLLYVFILVQSFTLFVGKIALMANVLICYNWMPTLNKVSCILYLVSFLVRPWAVVYYQSLGTVSGSGTGPLDYGATGPVPDP